MKMRILVGRGRQETKVGQFGQSILLPLISKIALRFILHSYSAMRSFEFITSQPFADFQNLHSVNI